VVRACKAFEAREYRERLFESCVAHLRAESSSSSTVTCGSDSGRRPSVENQVAALVLGSVVVAARLPGLEESVLASKRTELASSASKRWANQIFNEYGTHVDDCGDGRCVATDQKSQ